MHNPSEHDANSSSECETWRASIRHLELCFTDRFQVYTSLVSCVSKTSVIRDAIVFAKHAVHPQIWTALGDERHLIMMWQRGNGSQLCTILLSTSCNISWVCDHCICHSVTRFLATVQRGASGSGIKCLDVAPAYINWQLNCLLESRFVLACF